MVGNEQRQDIRQATMILPYFNHEVAVVYLADGSAYLPVRALCRMLGLHAGTHIPRWRKLVLWTNARKLPLQTAKGERIVWCLHRGALPFLCACFNWSLVSSERREQLRQATDVWLNEIEQAQRVMLDRYRSLRRDLFVFLESYSHAETWLEQWRLHFSATLDVASSRQLEQLLAQGKMLIRQTTEQARKMVQEQAMSPIVDVVTLDANGVPTETDTSFPLFPVVPLEDHEQFFASLRELAQWHREMATFAGRPKRS